MMMDGTMTVPDGCTGRSRFRGLDRSRGHGLWVSACRSLRYDCARVGLPSWRAALLLLAGPVASAVVALALLWSDADRQLWSGLMGGMIGLMVMLFAFMAGSVAMMEEAGDHRLMAGLVPMRRDAQVLGRFLFLLIGLAVMTVDIQACVGAFALFAGVGVADRFAVTWTDVVWETFAVMVIMVVLGSVILTLAFRFAYQRMMQVFFVMLGALYAAGALPMMFMDDFGPMVRAVGAFLAVSWHAVVVFGALAVAVWMGCLALSLRFWRRREL